MQKNFISRKLSYACGFLIVLIALAALVKSNSSLLASFDHAIQTLFSPLTSTSMTNLMAFLAVLGSPAVSLGLSVLVIIFTYFFFERSEAIWGLALIIIGNGGAFVIKHLVARARPIDKLVADSGYSFPSGHTFATALLVLLLLRLIVSRIKIQSVRLWLNILLPLWVIIIMCTRIYLHVHYPSDTFASLLWVGVIWQAGLACYYKLYGIIPGRNAY